MRFLPSSRKALCNRLSALFFMTASVSFYQAFVPATYRAFCGSLWSWIWCSLAKLKQQIMKMRCWPASKGLRLSMSPELTGYGSIMSIHQGLTDGMEAHWNHLEGKQHSRSMGFPKLGRDAVRPCTAAVQHPPRGPRISIWSKVIIITTFLASSSFHTKFLTLLGNGNLYLLPTSFFTYFVLFSLSLFLLTPFITFSFQLCNCINI